VSGGTGRKNLDKHVEQSCGGVACHVRLKSQELRGGRGGKLVLTGGMRAKNGRRKKGRAGLPGGGLTKRWWSSFGVSGKKKPR